MDRLRLPPAPTAAWNYSCWATTERSGRCPRQRPTMTGPNGFRTAPPGVLLNSAPAVAASADGCLDVFIVSQEAMLWHIRQTAPNDGWSDWVAHGTPSGVSFAQTRRRKWPAAPMDAWNCSSSVTTKRCGTCGRRPPMTAGRAGERTMLRQGRNSGGFARRLARARMDGWSCSQWAATPRCGTCGRSLPTTAGRSGFRTGPHRGFPCLPQ